MLLQRTDSQRISRLRGAVEFAGPVGEGVLTEQEVVLGGFTDAQRPRDPPNHFAVVARIGRHPTVPMGTGLLDVVADGFEVAGRDLVGLGIKMRVIRVDGRIGLVDDLEERIFQAGRGWHLRDRSRGSARSTRRTALTRW